jgi:hypothetical protein
MLEGVRQRVSRYLCVKLDKSWKNVRDKYVNFLSPDINRAEWTIEEDRKILDLVKSYGTKWKRIQAEIGTRTDNQIKNRFYGRLRVLLKRKARRRSLRVE